MKCTSKVRLNPRLNKDGKHAVLIHISINGERKMRSSGVFVFPDQWDNQENKVINHEKAGKLNLYLTRILNNIDEIFLEALDRGFKPNAEYVIKRTKIGKGLIVSPLVADFDDWAHRTNVGKSLRRLRLAVLKSLRNYEEQNGHIYYKQMGIQWLSSYVEGLHQGKYGDSKRPLTNKTIGTYITQIKTFMECMHLEVNRHDNTEYLVFGRWFKRHYKIESKRRVVLKPGEVRLIRSQISESITARRFLFQYYIGCRLVDTSSILFTDFYEYKGHMALSYINKKTGTESSFLLDKEAEEFIYELQSFYDPQDIRIFEEVETSHYNMKLKKLGEKLGLDRVVTLRYSKGKQIVNESKKVYECLTSHVARYSFGARYLELSKNDLRSLQSIFGHTSLQTTESYAKNSRTGALERQLGNL